VGCEDVEVLAQVPAYRFGLCRRFDNDKILRHFLERSVYSALGVMDGATVGRLNYMLARRLSSRRDPDSRPGSAAKEQETGDGVRYGAFPVSAARRRFRRRPDLPCARMPAPAPAG